jgi:anti-sigma regulatory factor (Ser/Thr protein kinase)
MRHLHLDVDSDNHAPRIARHTARTWLERVECDDDTRIDVVLLVDEIVTEAVHHQATRISAEMNFDTGRLRIDVHDDRPATDSPARCAVAQIAPQVADGWGRDDSVGGSHTWVEFLC